MSRKMKLCKEGWDLDDAGLCVYLANMSDRPVDIIATIRPFGQPPFVTQQRAVSPSLLSFLAELSVPDCRENINAHASTGWIRLHRRMPLLNGSSPFVKEDQWLRMHIEIKLLGFWELQISMGPIVSRTPQRSLPQIEDHAKAHTEGTQNLLKLYFVCPL